MIYLIRGIKLAFEPGMKRYVFIPLLLNILTFIGLFITAKNHFSLWVNQLVAFTPDWVTPDFLPFIEWILWLIFASAILIFIFYTFMFMANLIGAPFYGFLSEKVEAQLTGKHLSGQFSIKRVISILLQSLKREIRKILYLLPRVLGLCVVTIALLIIPAVNFISPLLWFLFGAWVMAIQYSDYPMANNQVPFMQMRDILKYNMSSSYGFGISIMLAFMLPTLNLIIMPAAVCGATIMWVEKYKPLT